MARGKPGEWQRWNARHTDRITRERMADDLVKELRAMPLTEDEDSVRHSSASTGDAVIIATMDFQGIIEIKDCTLNRRRVIEPEKP